MQRPLNENHLKMVEKLQNKVAQSINWQQRDTIAQENRSALSLLTFDYVKRNKGAAFANKVRQAIEDFDLEVSGITPGTDETDVNGHEVHDVNLRIGDIHAEVQFKYGYLDGWETHSETFEVHGSETNADLRKLQEAVCPKMAADLCVGHALKNTPLKPPVENETKKIMEFLESL